MLNIFRSCGYEVPVAVLLTKLCTLNGCLPQGAPTSAYLSNLVMKSFDKKLGKYCEAHRIRYTRYADDMTFSGELDVAEILQGSVGSPAVSLEFHGLRSAGEGGKVATAFLK